VRGAGAGVSGDETNGVPHDEIPPLLARGIIAEMGGKSGGKVVIFLWDDVCGCRAG